jgi:predicted ATPase/DNA-binding winged helix-turn-helix (wHTH) protein
MSGPSGPVRGEVMDKEGLHTPDVLRLVGCTVDLRKGQCIRKGEVNRLSTTEVRFLQYVASHPRRDVSREELLEQVWGYHSGAQTRTIDTTVRRLRKKVEEVPSAPRHIITVHGTGYRFEPQRSVNEDPVAEAIPRDTTPFFGRTQARASLVDHLEAGRSLVTVTGPGGIGKTRFVQWALHELQDRWRPCIVDLTEASSADDLRTATAMALGVPLSAPDEIAARIAALLARRATVVVLDGIEHVADHAHLIAGWVAPESPSRFIATSRVRLGLREETVLDLAPLTDEEAVEMLLARARTVRQDFGLQTPADVLDRIVQRLDRMPLAIELAAARARVLDPEDLLRRLTRGLDILRDPAQQDRHTTLRETIRWSWSDLEPWARSALSQCTVFRGGFDLPAAEAVIQLPEDAPPAIDVIESLVDCSMLYVHRGSAEARIGLFDSIRAFAADHLTGRDAKAAQRAHCTYYLTAGAHHAAEADKGALRDLQWLQTERENLLQIATTGVPEDRMQALLNLYPVHVSQGFPPEELTRLQTLLAESTELPPQLELEGRFTLARFQANRGLREAASIRFEACLALAEPGTALTGRIHRSLGATRAKQGRTDEAAALFQQALTDGIASECEEAEYGGRMGLAQIAREQNRFDEAEQQANAVLELTRQRGRRLWEPVPLLTLGMLARSRNELDTARKHFEDAAQCWSESRYLPGICLANALLGQALIELSHDPADLAHAVALLATVEDLEAYHNNPVTGPLRLQGEALLLEIEGAFDPARTLIREALRRVRGGGSDQILEGTLCLQLGTLTHQLGDRTGAAISYEKAASLPLPAEQEALRAGFAAVLTAEAGDGEAARAGLARMADGATAPTRAANAVLSALVEWILAPSKATRAAATTQLAQAQNHAFTASTYPVRRAMRLLEAALTG